MIAWLLKENNCFIKFGICILMKSMNEIYSNDYSRTTKAEDFLISRIHFQNAFHWFMYDFSTKEPSTNDVMLGEIVNLWQRPGRGKQKCNITHFGKTKALLTSRLNFEIRVFLFLKVKIKKNSTPNSKLLLFAIALSCNFLLLLSINYVLLEL